MKKLLSLLLVLGFLLSGCSSENTFKGEAWTYRAGDVFIVVLNDNLVWKPAFKSHYLGNNITIYCNPGSTSQQHARDWGMKMKLLSEYSGRQ